MGVPGCRGASSGGRGGGGTVGARMRGLGVSGRGGRGSWGTIPYDIYVYLTRTFLCSFVAVGGAVGVCVCVVGGDGVGVAVLGCVIH